MIRIRWTDPAVNDLRAIRNYVARDSKEAAISLAKKIIAAPERLTLFPKMGRMVPESDDPNIRELIVERNYRVIYQWKRPYPLYFGNRPRETEHCGDEDQTMGRKVVAPT